MRLFLFILFVFPCAEASVLYIGDSQSAGYLGHLVFKDLIKRYAEDEVKVFGVGSSSPRHWSSAPTEKNGKWLCQRKGRMNSNYQISLKNYICKGPKNQPIYKTLLSQKPDVVIFQFLGNSVGFNNNYVKGKVKKLIDSLNHEKCLFLTSPPNYYEFTERNKKRASTEQAIVDAAGTRCQVYRGMQNGNLQGFAKNRDFYAGDKIHLTRKGAEAFFAQIQPYLP